MRGNDEQWADGRRQQWSWHRTKTAVQFEAVSDIGQTLEDRSGHSDTDQTDGTV